MIIKPRKTYYNQHAFNSSLEARYAILFDQLGWTWIHTPDSYELPSGIYCPDFYINELDIYIKIIYGQPTDHQSQQAYELSSGIRKAVVILSGLPHVSYEGKMKNGTPFFVPSNGHNVDIYIGEAWHTWQPKVKYLGFNHFLEYKFKKCSLPEFLNTLYDISNIQFNEYGYVLTEHDRRHLIMLDTHYYRQKYKTTTHPEYRFGRCSTMYEYTNNLYFSPCASLKTTDYFDVLSAIKYARTIDLNHIEN